MIEITTVYNIWWLLLIVALSAALSFLLYFRNKKDGFPTWLNLGLGTFRFIVFFILGFLLLSPLIKNWESQIEKPVILLAIDNSQSMTLYGDSIQLANQNSALIQDVKQQLEDKFDVISYTFGSEIAELKDLNFAEQSTDINQLFENLLPKFQYRNVGAMVLISDGISNVGQNPIYGIGDAKFPIYTVGIGDTTVYSDYAIKHLIYNKNVFINNAFPVEVSLMAKKMKGKRAKISIKQKNEIIASKEVSLQSDHDLVKEVFLINAKTAGLISYQVVVESFEGERNITNNKEVFFVEVLGEKRKILMLYDSPHPDVSALSQVMNASDEYELHLMQFGQSTFNTKDYSLIIFHQIPNSSSRSASIIQKANSEHIPTLIMLGNNSNIPLFNSLNLGVRIEAGKTSFVESGAIVDNSFVDFALPKNFKQDVNQYPPLINPYGKYIVSSAFHNIINQRIGSVATDYPLISVSGNSGQRNAFIFGEGIWRWRMYDFIQHQNHQAVDEFLLKLLRFVSLNKTFTRFDLQSENRYSNQEDIDFNATFYNASYEPVLDADVRLEITNESGDVFSYAFGSGDISYYLSAGRFAEGTYRFKSWVDYAGEHFEKTGQFIVDAMNLEAANLVANYPLLQKIALNSDAAFYEPSESQSLIDELIGKKEIVNIERKTIQYQDLIKFREILFLLLILLSVEWFFRKQMGSY